MASNEYEVDINDEDITEEDFSPEKLGDETTDWQAEASGLKGIAKRRATKLRKAKEALAKAKEDLRVANEKLTEVLPKDKKEIKPNDLDYGQKAFLIASGIKEADEIDFVKEVMASTGKTLEDVLGSKYFQAELGERREAKAVKGALPTDTNRTGTPARNTVDFWLAKGELPPNTPENRQLRIDVVDAKMKAQKEGSHFTDTPVVTNSNIVAGGKL